MLVLCSSSVSIPAKWNRENFRNNNIPQYKRHLNRFLSCFPTGQKKAKSNAIGSHPAESQESFNSHQDSYIPPALSNTIIREAHTNLALVFLEGSSSHLPADCSALNYRHRLWDEQILTEWEFENYTREPNSKLYSRKLWNSADYRPTGETIKLLTEYVRAQSPKFCREKWPVFLHGAI